MSCLCLERSERNDKNYEKMPASSRLMMKMFIKMLKAKKDKTEAEREMIKMISASYDISDKRYIEPVLECLERQI